ncbi:LacI family DNA-binding transcriptional regulator [Chitinophaga pinensis]|uniref:LacI family DNA-binding transcriptional regulator n=1 Tax=Chitinophaga pinensis TaxID=79329 RepID=UPI0021BDA2BD|nr:LacI family DNA-binding transcriptional regulator [Chitinophaga pinensis]
MANEREVTIYDIARELNISATTVSRGLQDHPTISKKTKRRSSILLNRWAIAVTTLHVVCGARKQTLSVSSFPD